MDYNTQVYNTFYIQSMVQHRHEKNHWTRKALSFIFTFCLRFLWWCISQTAPQKHWRHLCGREGCGFSTESWSLCLCAWTQAVETEKIHFTDMTFTSVFPKTKSDIKQTKIENEIKWFNFNSKVKENIEELTLEQLSLITSGSKEVTGSASGSPTSTCHWPWAPRGLLWRHFRTEKYQTLYEKHKLMPLKVKTPAATLDAAV